MAARGSDSAKQQWATAQDSENLTATESNRHPHTAAPTSGDELGALQTAARSCEADDLAR